MCAQECVFAHDFAAACAHWRKTLCMPGEDRRPSDDEPTEGKPLLAGAVEKDDGKKSPATTTCLFNVVTLVYCFIYLLVGPSLIVVNKTLLKDAGFGYPMLVSGLGQASSAIGAWVSIRVLELESLEKNNHIITFQFYSRNMMAVGGATAASLCLGNAGYMFLTVSFVQILKAFTPVFVVALLWALGIEIPSQNVVLAVLMLSVGTAIASVGEMNMNALGIFIMFWAEMSEATRLVLTQKLLTNLRFGALEGLYYMAPICTLWMWGLACIIEVPFAVRTGAFPRLFEKHSPTVALAAVLGFAVNVASFLVIKRTSSTTLKLMGTVRNAGLVLFSALFLGEVVTGVQALGYAITLTFFGVYTTLKMSKQ